MASINKDNFAWIDTSKTYTPSPVAGMVGRDTANTSLFVRTDSSSPNNLTKEEEKYFLAKAYNDSYNFEKDQYDYTIAKYAELYKGKDPSAYADRVELAKELNALFPQYSEEYFFDNAENFMYMATGVKQDVKGYLDNLGQIWNATWANAKHSADVMMLYLSNPNEWGTETFQQKKQNMFKRDATNGSAYRKDIYGKEYDSNPFLKMLSATTEQAPNIAFNLALMGVTWGASAGVSASMKAAGATSKALASAGKAITGLRIASELGYTFMTEGGSIVSSMAEMGFDDDIIATVGFTAALLTSALETFGDEMTWLPSNRFAKLLFDNGGNQAVEAGFDMFINNLKDAGSAEITEPSEEYMESIVENLAYGVANYWETKRGRNLAEEIGFTKYEVVDNIKSLAKNIYLSLKKGSEEGIEAAGQAAWSTPLMNLGSSFIGDIGSFAWGANNHTRKGAEYFNLKGAENVVDKKNIVIASVEGVNTDGVKLTGKVEPVEAVRIGSTVFVKNATPEQALAIKNSEYVLTKELDEVSFEKKYSTGDKKETAKKNGALDLINSDNTNDTGLKISPANAERLLVEEYNTGKLNSYSYLLENGTLSQQNDGTATALIVERKNLDGTPFKIEIDQSIDGKHVSNEKILGSLNDTVEAMASVFADPSAIQSFVASFTDDQLSTYGQKNAEKNSKSKDSARKKKEKKKAEAKKKSSEKTTESSAKTEAKTEDKKEAKPAQKESKYADVLKRQNEMKSDDVHADDGYATPSNDSEQEDDSTAPSEPTPAVDNGGTQSTEGTTTTPAPTEAENPAPADNPAPAEPVADTPTEAPAPAIKAEDKIAEKIQKGTEIKKDFKDFESKRKRSYDKVGVGEWSYRDENGNKTTRESATYLSVATPKGTQTTFDISSWSDSDLEAVDKMLNGNSTEIKKNALDNAEESKKKALEGVGVKDAEQNSTQTYGEAPVITETETPANTETQTPAETETTTPSEEQTVTNVTKPAEEGQNPSEAPSEPVTRKDVEEAETKILEEGDKDVTPEDAENGAVIAKVVADATGDDYKSVVEKASKNPPIKVDENTTPVQIVNSLAEFFVNNVADAKKFLTEFYGQDMEDTEDNRTKFVSEVSTALLTNERPDTMNPEIFALLREGCSALMTLRADTVKDSVAQSVGVELTNKESAVTHQINAEDTAKEVGDVKKNIEAVKEMPKTKEENPASRDALRTTTFTDYQMKRMEDGGVLDNIVQSAYTDKAFLQTLVNMLSNPRTKVDRAFLENKMYGVLSYAIEQLSAKNFDVFGTDNAFDSDSFPKPIKEAIRALVKASIYMNVLNELSEDASKTDIIKAFNNVKNDPTVVARYKNGEMAWNKVIGKAMSNNMRMQEVRNSRTAETQNTTSSDFFNENMSLEDLEELGEFLSNLVKENEEKSKRTDEEFLEDFKSDAEAFSKHLKEGYREEYIRLEKQLRSDKDNFIFKDGKSAKPVGLTLGGKKYESKLSYPLWVLVRTGAFKEWFGDWQDDNAKHSYAVDANGEPKLFYHGTGEDFDAFDITKAFTGEGGNATGHGFYFTSLLENAEHYKMLAQEKGQKGVLLPVFLNVRKGIGYDFRSGANGAQISLKKTWLKKILDYSLRTIGEDSLWYDAYSYEGYQSMLNHLISAYEGSSDLTALCNDLFGDNYGEFLKAMNMATGYDSAETYVPETGATHIIAWFANQIKSSDNNGEFSSYDDRYRYQFGGEKGAMNGGWNSMFNAGIRALENGVDPREVFEKTYVFKGHDGHYKIDISDKYARLKSYEEGMFPNGEPVKYDSEGNITKEWDSWDAYMYNKDPSDPFRPYITREGVKLGEVLEHEELYSFYPFLKDINVRVERMDGDLGAYTDFETEIVLNSYALSSLSKREMTGLVLHEIQHIIQYYEGFATGITDSTIRTINGLYESTGDERYLDAVHYPFDRMKSYYASSGEIEAFNVQNRYVNKDFDSYPLDTEDTSNGLKVYTIMKNGDFYDSTGSFVSNIFKAELDEFYKNNPKYAPRADVKIALDNGRVAEALEQVKGSEFVDNNDGLLTFNKEGLSRHTYNLGAEYGSSPLVDSAMFAAEYLTSLSPAVQDSIIRYNMVLNGSVDIEDIEVGQFFDTTKALEEADRRNFEENRDSIKGAVLLDRAQTILNSSADLSTIIHENNHIVMRANPEVRNAVLESLSTVTKDAEKRAKLENTVRNNLQMFERFREDGMDDEALVSKTMGLFDIATEDSFFTNVDVEEAIAQLFETWVYNKASEDFDAGLSSIFSKIWETLKNIYRYVVGECEFPDEIDDAFMMFFDNSLTRQDVIEIKNSMSPIVYSSLRNDLKKGTAQTRTYQKWADVIIDGISDDKLAEINNEFKSVIGDRFIEVEDLATMRLILEKNGIMQEVIAKSGVKEEQEQLMDKVVAMIAYSNESLPVVAQRIADMADALVQKTPKGKPSKDKNGNLKFVKRNSAEVKALEALLHGGLGYDRRPSNKADKRTYVDSPTNGLIARIRYYNLMAAKSKLSTFRTKLGISKNAEGVTLLSQALDYATKAGKKIDGLNSLGLLLDPDSNGFSENLSVEDIYNLVTTLIVNTDGTPVCWTANSANIKEYDKAGMYRDAGVYVDGILPYLLNYAHLDTDGRGDFDYNISDVAFINANEDFVRASSQMFFEKYEEDIANGVQNPAGLLNGTKPVTQAQYMFHSNIAELVNFIREKVEGGLPVIEPDMASYDYLSSIEKEFSDKLKEAKKNEARLNVMSNSVKDIQTTVSAIMTKEQENNQKIVDNWEKAKANTKEGEKARKEILNIINNQNVEQLKKINELFEKNEKIAQALEEKEDTLTEKESQIADLTDELATIKKSLSEAMKTVKSIEKIKEVLEGNNGEPLTEDEAKILNAVFDELKQKNHDLSSTVNRLNEAQKRIDELKQENKKLSDELKANSKLSAVQDEKSRLAQAIVELKKIANDKAHSKSYATRQVKAFLEAFSKASVAQREEVKHLKSGDKTIVHPATDRFINMDTAFREFYDNLMYMTDLFGNPLATGMSFTQSDDLIEFAQEHGMFEMVVDENGDLETDENGNLTNRAKVLKSYTQLTVEDLADLSEILAKMQEEENELRAQYVAEQNRQKIKTDKIVVEDTIRFGKEKKRGREMSFSDYKNQLVTNGKEYDASINNGLRQLLGAFEELAPKLRGRLNALYTIFFGGELNGVKYDNDLNTRFNGRDKMTKLRLYRAFGQMANILNEAGIEKTVGLSGIFGHDSGEWTADDIMRYYNRIFNAGSYNLDDYTWDDFVEISKNNGDDAEYLTVKDGRKEKLIEPLKVRPEVRHIVRLINEKNKELETKSKRLESKQKRVDSLLEKERRGTITEKETAQLERAEKSLNKLKREVKELEGFGMKMNSDGTIAQNQQRYSPQMFIGIYLLAQQEGGLNKLLNDYCVDSEGNLAPKGGIASANLSIGNVLDVMQKMLYDEDFKWMRQIAEVMQEEIGSRREVMGDVFWRINGYAMDIHDRYFVEVSADDTARFGQDVSLDVMGRYLGAEVNDSSVQDREKDAKYRPNLYSMDNFIDAIYQQEHYIWVAEWVDSLNRMMKKKLEETNDGEFTEMRSELGDAIMYAFGEKHGAQLIRQLEEMVRAVAGTRRNDGEARAMINWWSKLRSNSAVGALAMSIPSFLQQFPTLLYAAEDVGMKDTIEALYWYLTSDVSAFENLENGEEDGTDKATSIEEELEGRHNDSRTNIAIGENEINKLTDFIYNYSPQMQMISEEHVAASKNTRTMGQYLKGKKGAESTIGMGLGEAHDTMMDVTMWALDHANTFIAKVTWLAYYKHNYENGNRGDMTELQYREMCANEATQKTMDITPSQNPKDKASVYRTNDQKMKELTLFTEQINKMTNKTITNWKGFRDGNLDWKKLARFGLYSLIISAATSLISGNVLPTEKDRKENKNFLLKLFGYSLLEFISNNTSIIGDDIRDLISGVIYYSNESPVMHLVSLGNNAKNVFKKKSEKNKTRFVNSLLEVLTDAAQIAGGFPTNFAKKTWRALREKNWGYIYNSRVGKYREGIKK